MTRTDLSWLPLALVLLVAPAALHAQAQTSDSAKKAKDPSPTSAVVCRDGTAGAGVQGCAGHGGVDAVTTNASRNGRVDSHPVESGQTDPMGLPGGTGVRIKTDTTQPPGWGMPPDIKSDSSSATSDST